MSLLDELLGLFIVAEAVASVYANPNAPQIQALATLGRFSRMSIGVWMILKEG